MITEANSAGLYHSDLWQTDYPKIQIRTVGELLQGNGFEMPPHQPMYQASHRIAPSEGKQGRLGVGPRRGVRGLPYYPLTLSLKFTLSAAEGKGVSA